ncbi:hypothetical protein [Kitasatospora purpeofusca]|uniref:hypothetical protein n=1 Tax=Kitasatospora purpeofusca TaxID=67352 RepID=UPI00381A2898
MLLPYGPQSAAAARRLVRSALRLELEGQVEAAELVVGWLGGNSAKRTVPVPCRV